MALSKRSRSAKTADPFPIIFLVRNLGGHPHAAILKDEFSRAFQERARLHGMPVSTDYIAKFSRAVDAQFFCTLVKGRFQIDPAQLVRRGGRWLYQTK